MGSILCIVNGGMGDEILTLPALRYLHSIPGAEGVEIRLGAWRSRNALFQKLLGTPQTVLPLEDLIEQRDPIHYDWILHMDIRTLRGIVPSNIQAKNGFFCFEKDKPHQNPILIAPKDQLYWQHCFEMAFRFACRIQGKRYSRSNMIECRDRFRISIPDQEESPRIEKLLAIAPPEQLRMAVTPGGYNPPHKVWRYENFGKAICHAVSRGVTVFVLGAPEELELAQKLYEFVSAQPEAWKRSAPGNLSFVTGLLELADLPDFLGRMDFHLSNDNGVAQIAGAMNLPQIVLYRAKQTPHGSIGFHDLPLFSGDEWSMNGLSPAEVIDAIDRKIDDATFLRFGRKKVM
jgi:ADP-heptose:LPS heptosyltransferase